MGALLLCGDASVVLRTLPAGSVRTVVTSPPYYGLRDYGSIGQLGGEATPAAYIDAVVGVMREVRRVLVDDGTLWLNLGDSYNSPASNQNGGGLTLRRGPATLGQVRRGNQERGRVTRRPAPDLKPKDLIGIPWRVALALQADGWWLRSDIIWDKPNAMPQSAVDRPTTSHEYLFLLTKRRRYYYDADSVRTPSGANRRTVWRIPTRPQRGAHFAVFPPALVEPCVLAGSRPGDLVLDPFCGSGTVGAVAQRLGRDFVGVDLNPDYLALAAERVR